jgi:PAS domain-containing protein
MSACTLPSLSNETDLLASVFDALPVPALVVDNDVRIIDFNLAAARLLEYVPFAVLRPRAGEALACIHSTEALGGCGHADACQDCVIRNSVREIFQGEKTFRKVARMELKRVGQIAGMDFLVTVAPVPNESEPLALLILEDAAELSRLLAIPAASSPDSKARGKARGRKTGNS